MKKSNLIALAMSVTLAASSAVYAASASSYNDINGNWAQSDITTMVDMKVMNGFNDGNFHPDAWITRSEFTAMAGKTLGLEPKNADTVPSFKQLSQNYWNLENVDNQAWISAYPSGVFRPANPVRRVEALSALAGALNKPLVSDAEATQILGKYSDADQIPANARRQVATAINYNLFEIEPKSGANVIEPLRPVTRAETAALLSDLYQNKGIAVVQNGQVVADNQQGSEAMTNSGTSAVSEAPAAAGTAASAQANESAMTTSATSTDTANNKLAAAGATGTDPGATPSTTDVGGSSTTESTTSGESTTTGESTTQGQSTTTTGESTTQSQTTTTGESTTPGQTTTTGESTTPGQTTTTGESATGNQQTTASAPDTTSGKVGYKNTPYRHSADTIPEFRTVNTTETPSNLEASAPINLPANTTFTGTVAKALYSEYNQPGDPVMVILDHPLFDSNGKIVAPAGSKVLGTVSNVVSRNTTNDNAQLGIAFNGIVTPEGQRIPLNATIASNDGILKAGELQGVVFHPNHSTAALKREISSAEGAMYGTKQGKEWTLNEPLSQQLSSAPVDAMDKRPSDIVIGVGDRLQLRVESEQSAPSTTGQ